jgi:hypothetical protein|tara:strand:- start:157 stop:585 length:429 start_codon:yes stop_codon:yes gene_type:complete
MTIPKSITRTFWVFVSLAVTCLIVGSIRHETKNSQIKKASSYLYDAEKVCEYEFDGTKYDLYFIYDTYTYTRDALKIHNYKFVSFSGFAYNEVNRLTVSKVEFYPESKSPTQMAIDKHINELKRDKKLLSDRAKLIDELKCE